MNSRSWIARRWRGLRTRLNGEVAIDGATRRLIAEDDRQVQQRVERSWLDWNAERTGEDDDVIGVCCSGGGLRSAAFNLGALQVLHKRNIMQRAAWVSAVSGGSYIAAAHYLVQSDFRQDAQDDRQCVDAEDDDAALTAEQRRKLFTHTPPYALGSPEERWLRTHSSYLADGWRTKMLLAGQVLFGAFVILTCVAVLLALVAILASVAGSAIFPELRSDRTVPAQIAANDWVWAGLGLLGASLVCAVAVVGMRLRDAVRARWRHAGVVLAVIAVVLLSVSFGLPRLIVVIRTVLGEAAAVGTADAPPADAGDLSRWYTVLGALGLPPLLITAFSVLTRGVRTLGPETRSRLLRRIRPVLTTLVAAIAGPLLLGATFLQVYNLTTRLSATTAMAVWLLVLFIGAWLAYAVDPTAASLHTFYKSRLASAFNVVRVGQPGAGFGPKEFDAACERHVDQLTLLSASDVPGYPKLVVGAAANVSNRGATPTGRNAVPFTFSADWIGGGEIGWIETPDLERRVREGRKDMRRDVTLLAAVAMSGAAVSPAMGKMSRPAYRMLLTLVNARLGVWLPNPRYSRTVAPQVDGPHAPVDGPAAPAPRSRLDRVSFVGNVRAKRREIASQPPAGPRNRPGLAWLFREMLGLMSNRARRIYVTDGGHYENLGLIELLRRKCTLIYCFDASGDPPDSFTTLAETLALARTDLGVEIPVDPETLRQQMQTIQGNGRPHARLSHVVIPFRYSADAKVAGHRLKEGVTPASGTLVYVKCRVTASAPWDVRALYERDPRFPDHSTADQLYTDERLEAYRALGAHLASSAVDDPAAQREARRVVGHNAFAPAA